MEKSHQTITETAFQWWNLAGGSEENIYATEFWLDRQFNTVTTKHVQAAPPEREAWLRRSKNDQQHSLVARFAWVFVDKKSKNFNISESVHDRLHQHFRLGPAFKSMKSMAGGVVALPRESTEELDRQAYAFSLGPQVGAIWCHNRHKTNKEEACTDAIIYTRAVAHPDEDLDDLDKQFTYQEIINKVSNWESTVFSTPVFPAYFFSLALSHEIDAAYADIQSSMTNIESRTGFHSFTGRNRTMEAELETEMLITMGHDSSGLSTRIVNETRKSLFIQELLAIMGTAAQENRDRARGDKKDGAVAGSSYLNSHCASMRTRVKIQGVELTFTEKKVQVLREMIINYISQIEISNNAKIGEEVKLIAASTHKTANCVHISSSTVGLLTLVNMLFLSGILVANLFSANLLTGWASEETSEGDESSPAEGPVDDSSSRWDQYKDVTMTLILILVGVYYLVMRAMARLRVAELRGDPTPSDPDTVERAIDMLEKKRNEHGLGVSLRHRIKGLGSVDG